MIVTPPDVVLAALVAACAASAVLPWRPIDGDRRLRRFAPAGACDDRDPDRPHEQHHERGGWWHRHGPAGDAAGPPRPELGIVLELLAVAIGAGSALPRALRVTGAAVGGPDGQRLARAGAALELGASWAEAWQVPPDVVAARPRRRGRGARRAAASTARMVGLVRDSLRAAWVDGAAPGPLLRAAEDRLAHDAAAAAQEAAERLGVRLVVPLGTCLLPAFVLMGLVPVVVALGGGLL